MKLHSKCRNCHNRLGIPIGFNRLRGKQRSEKCRTEKRSRQLDKGAAVYQLKETRQIRRCPKCGRTETLDWQVKDKTLKHWKDNKCSKDNKDQGNAKQVLVNELDILQTNNQITEEQKQALRHSIKEELQ